VPVHNGIVKSIAVGTWYFCWTQCSQYIRYEDTVLLSESLDEDAVQILVDVALSNNFPEQCNEWHVAMMGTRKRFHQDLSERQDKVFRDLRCQEASLKRALRDEIVGDVMKLFP
jgi:hypothetical protein